jgi:hypothetical protein
MKKNDNCDFTHASEQEWRRILYTKIENVENKLNSMSEWILVYRILGAGAFALLVAYVSAR